MKNSLIVLICNLVLISVSNAEIKDCSELNKLSKDYLNCTKLNLKNKSDEAGLTNTFNNFKSSKTLTELFQKNKGEK